MSAAVVVQARLNSTRLFGKTLLELSGKPILEHVLRRCSAIPGIDVVVCAVPDLAESDRLITVAERCAAVVVRGPETDVLARYLLAAEAVRADVVMRITSDCPLIDPLICARVLDLRAQRRVAYACNNLPPSFPHGLDCEAMTIDALRKAAETARKLAEREHVTPWLREMPQVNRANLVCEDATLRQHRWTLDYPADLAFFRALFSHFNENAMPSMYEVLDVIAAHPEISKINAMHRADNSRLIEEK